MNIFVNVRFPFATFTLHLEARERLYLPPYKGSTIRGGFGHVFKRVCCIAPPGTCRNACQLGQTCAYGYIFETPQSADSDIPIQATNLPHPFVILPPLTKQEVFEPGEKLEVRITLVGSSIEFIPYFVYSFEELGKIGVGRGNGRYVLTHVTDRDGKEIYSGITKTFTSDFRILELSEFFDTDCDTNQITMEFITPTRILYHGKPTGDLTFELFIRNLLRRASSLAEIHCGQKWQLDYRHIIDRAAQEVVVKNRTLSWHHWERYSNRQNRRMNFGGFVGSVTFEGSLSAYIPLIMLGRYIHIGKNTSFGMGKFVVRG